jgi:hypothetical protein
VPNDEVVVVVTVDAVNAAAVKNLKCRISRCLILHPKTQSGLTPNGLSRWSIMEWFHCHSGALPLTSMPDF